MTGFPNVIPNFPGFLGDSAARRGVIPPANTRAAYMERIRRGLGFLGIQPGIAQEVPGAGDLTSALRLGLTEGLGVPYGAGPIATTLPTPGFTAPGQAARDVRHAGDQRIEPRGRIALR